MRNLNILASLTVFATVFCISAEAQRPAKLDRVPPNANIDYPGFVKLAREVEPIRAKRRIPLAKFQKMAWDPKTIVLDTRSQAAYDEIHWVGAVHLNFSDFTDAKLAKVIPDKRTRILIYCNNNFENPPTAALLTKSAPLALNIPTFVNLYGYGYQNIYELADVVKVDDPRIRLVGTRMTLPTANQSAP